MRPTGLWGSKEFAQFTDDELHETMMESQPGSEYFEWAKAELAHRDRRQQREAAAYNIVNIGTAIHSPIQQAGAHSTQGQYTTYDSVKMGSLTRLVNELTDHLDELGLNEPLKRSAETQIATLKAQLTGEPDPLIVQQAGRTLRSITEGAVGSLLATAAQPHVWHWVQQAMSTLFPK